MDDKRIDLDKAIEYIEISLYCGSQTILKGDLPRYTLACLREFKELKAKQVPVKPREHHNWDDICNDSDHVNECWLCKCNNFIDESDNYCPECGQKIDWS